MTTMFLCIQNPGEAPVEGFTLLGLSTTRDCGVDGVIGMFGSGNKHAINVLLRAGLRFTAYCGLTKLEFYCKDDEINDGLLTKSVKRVVCKMGGTSTRTIDLGWVLDFGAADWTEVGMALREFISNAIDRTIREEGDFTSALKEGRLAVMLVEKCQAKSGYTRVYIEADAGVQQYVRELPVRFLHFSENPNLVQESFLPKAQRNLSGKKSAVIYRMGVFVREMQDETASVYDYNFKSWELKIDECRNSSDYNIKAAIARLYRKASATELHPVFKTFIDGTQTFEASLDHYYICSSWETPTEKEQQEWTSAWQSVAANAVMCGPSGTAEFVRRKGWDVKTVQAPGFLELASRFGIKTDAQVLTECEKKGCEKLPATDEVLRALDEVWSWLDAYKLTGDVEKPQAGCFRDTMNAGSRTFGFCDDVGVYIATDQATYGPALLKIMLEEAIHWVTKATDGSRDLQDFAFRMLVEVLS